MYLDTEIAELFNVPVSRIIEAKKWDRRLNRKNGVTLKISDQIPLISIDLLMGGSQPRFAFSAYGVQYLSFKINSPEAGEVFEELLQWEIARGKIRVNMPDLLIYDEYLKNYSYAVCYKEQVLGKVENFNEFIVGLANLSQKIDLSEVFKALKTNLRDPVRTALKEVLDKANHELTEEILPLLLWISRDQ